MHNFLTNKITAELEYELIKFELIITFNNLYYIYRIQKYDTYDNLNTTINHEYLLYLFRIIEEDLNYELTISENSQEFFVIVKSLNKTCP